MLRRRLTAAAIVATAACAVAVPLALRADAQERTQPQGLARASGSSSTDCGERTNYTPFTFLGDTNPYWLTTGGDFESSITDWFGSAVTRVAENEPWAVGGASDGWSAQLMRNGATLSAPSMCVKDDEPTLRFFYKAPGVQGATLKVKLRTTGSADSTTRTVVIDGSKAGWQVSDPISINDNTDHTGTQRLSLDITSSGNGSWLIDDVYVDPWKYVAR